MYTQLRQSLATVSGERFGVRGRLRVSRNVVYLGLTSFFTDISSEMVSTILPLYLFFSLRTSALQLGIADGLYQGVTALVQMGSGAVADQGSRHKQVALAGYGLSAAGKLGLLAAAGSFLPLVGVLMADRVGKGIRTAPRDALISLSARRDQLGAAFGVHRALDTAGALLGPLVAFGLLALLPGRFDTVFVVSFCFAGLGLATLALLVEGRRPAGEPARSAFSPRAALALLGRARFRAVVLAAGLLGLATISDAFVYLVLQSHLAFDARFLPLLYVVTSLAYLALAVPMGTLADRCGRQRVLLLGYGLLLLVYLALLTPAGGLLLLVGALLAFGAYYACTDGVMSALASAALSEERRSTGLGLLLTVVALSRLAGSVLFGAAWTAWGAQAATAAFMAGLAGALVLAGLALGWGSGSDTGVDESMAPSAAAPRG